MGYTDREYQASVLPVPSEWGHRGKACMLQYGKRVLHLWSGAQFTHRHDIERLMEQLSNSLRCQRLANARRPV